MGRAAFTRRDCLRQLRQPRCGTLLYPQVHMDRPASYSYSILTFLTLVNLKNLGSDQLASSDPATQIQQKAHSSVHENRTATLSHLNRRNAPIMDPLRQSSRSTIVGSA